MVVVKEPVQPDVAIILVEFVLGRDAIYQNCLLEGLHVEWALLHRGHDEPLLGQVRHAALELLQGIYLHRLVFNLILFNLNLRHLTLGRSGTKL